MGVLTEYVRTEGARLKAESEQRAAAVAEWTAAVGRLYDQLADWIRDADGGNDLLRVRRIQGVPIDDPGLGVYEGEKLTIRMGSSSVDLLPLSRNVVEQVPLSAAEARRADGAVELLYGGNAVARLLRLKTAGGDAWYVRAPAWSWDLPGQRPAAVPLERNLFEGLVLGVLR